MRTSIYPLSILLLLLMANANLQAADCEALAKLQLANVTITKAEAVTDGTLQIGTAAPMKNLPPICRVAGISRPTADSEIQFETWLPLEGWNGRFQGVGNGGFAGSIGYGALASAVRQKYAVASTDTGHTGGDEPKWALQHPEKVIDFGWRGIHEMTVAAKALTTAFYGRKPDKSYFSSCSNGGRQALMEAQRFPEDYDGIIAGAPANNWTRLLTMAMNNVQAAHLQPETFIPPAKLLAIQAAAVMACDDKDGVADGVLEQPNLCKPDYKRLLCTGTENDRCLTAPQLKALETIAAGPRAKGGKSLYPAVSPGGEAEPGGWASWVTGTKQGSAALYFFGVSFYKYIVFGDEQWKPESFSLERDLQLAETKWAKDLNSTDPDLGRFAARGGKLILFHGWCDAAIPAESTIAYFRNVEKKVGTAKAAGFVRLFMAPGVQHCGGGAGPNQFGQAGPTGGSAQNDMDAALVQWVEKGVAPERIVATRKQPAAPNGVRTRPLCAYPLVAKYTGSGSTDDAANFRCGK